ncbi:MAG TPA: ABC transporter permease, partial [Povalibacter sp.]
SDRRAVIMTVIAPIVIASFFGYIFAGVGGDKGPARIAVVIVDEDSTSISRDIAEGAQSDRNLTVTLQTRPQAMESVREGKATVAVIIPQGFGQAAAQSFFSGQSRPELTILYDPSHRGEMGLVAGVMTQYIMRSVSTEVFSSSSANSLAAESLKQLESSGMPADQLDKLRDLIHSAQAYYAVAPASETGRTPGINVPYTVSEQAVTSGEHVAYNGYAHSFAGMGIQFVLIAAVDLGIGILTERQRGLWRRLRSAPISRRLLLAAKTASASIIGLSSLLISFGFAMIVFGVRIHGSIIGFVAVAAASAIMAATFGLLIAALGKTPQAVRGVSMLGVLVMLMLGGAWVPSFIFPAWLQQLTVVIPIRWAIDGLDAMTWRGLDLSVALTSTGVLLGFAALFSLLALWRFRWEE